MNTFPVLKFFEFAHLPAHLQDVSRDFHALAQKTANRASNHPSSISQTEHALHKLLEAKDCAVRAMLPTS
jgi:ferritin-like protein